MTLTLEQEVLISKISRKLNIPFNKVKEVFESDFRTMVQKTKEFDYTNPETHNVFLIPKFGKFVTNSIKAKKIYDRPEKNNTDTSEE
jgi:hypothetical protein